MSIKKIYTGDYSAEGYDDGFKHGKQGKPKSHFGTLKRHPINWLWQGDNANDSYSNSYNTGYTDGQRVSHDIYSPQRGGTMSTLEQQLVLLEQAKGAILHNKKILAGARDQYTKQVTAMKGAGFLDNYTTELSERSGRLSGKTDDVINELNQQLSMIEAFQGAIRRMIADAKGD